MRLTELTPEALRCGIGAICPAIFKTDRGTYVLVGNAIDEKTSDDLARRIGAGECAIEIPAALLDLWRQSPGEA